MRMHIKSPGDKPGFYPIVERGKDLKYLSFSVVELGGSLREYIIHTGQEEVSLDFYTGPVNVDIEWDGGRETYQIPARTSLREASPMIYVPSGATVRLRTLNGSGRVSVAGALGKQGVRPYCIQPGQVVSKAVGKDNWTRTVHTHIAD